MNEEERNDRLERLQRRADELDAAGERRNEEATGRELQDEFGWSGPGDPPGNLSDEAANGAFDEEDAQLKEEQDELLESARDEADRDGAPARAGLDDLEDLLDRRAEHLGVEEEQEGENDGEEEEEEEESDGEA